MNKKLFLLFAIAGLTSSQAAFGDTAPGAPGVVNFQTCMEKAKIAQDKRRELEGFDKQFRVKIDEIQKRCKEIDDKLNNVEYVDSITAEAEENLKKERQAEMQKLMGTQNEFQQIMQQQQMAFSQSFMISLGDAAKKVAKEKGLSHVIAKEACLYYEDNLDLTEDVISKINALYDKQQREAEKTAKTEKNGALEAPAAKEEGVQLEQKEAKESK